MDITGRHGPLDVTGTVFASVVDHAVGLRDSSGVLELLNATGPTQTSGLELFAVYAREPLTIIADYAFLHSTELSLETRTRQAVPLNPKHSAGLDVAWDNDETGTRVGVEAFYTGVQAIEQDPYRTISRPYTTLGVLISQQVGRALVFLNGENL